MLSYVAGLRPSLRWKVATHSSSAAQKKIKVKKNSTEISEKELPATHYWLQVWEFACSALFCRSLAPPPAQKYRPCSLDSLQENHYYEIYDSRVCKHKHERGHESLLPHCAPPNAKHTSCQLTILQLFSNIVFFTDNWLNVCIAKKLDVGPDKLASKIKKWH